MYHSIVHIVLSICLYGWTTNSRLCQTKSVHRSIFRKCDFEPEKGRALFNTSMSFMYVSFSMLHQVFRWKNFPFNRNRWNSFLSGSIKWNGTLLCVRWWWVELHFAYTFAHIFHVRYLWEGRYVATTTRILCNWVQIYASWITMEIVQCFDKIWVYNIQKDAPSLLFSLQPLGTVNCIIHLLLCSVSCVQIGTYM